MGCFKKLRKLVVLMVSLFADLFDFVSDWLFYSDVSLAKDGLVFGPHEDLIIRMTFAFCIIGSVTFAAEIILNFFEYYRDNDTVEMISEFLTFSTLLIEDLPQIAINVHIAMCREEATNTIQIVKASAAMFEVVVKLAFIWIKYFLKRRQGGIETGKIRKNLSIFTSVVLLTILGLSATVFYLTTNFQKTQIEFDSDGLSGEESEKYLQGVSIFMRFNTTNPQIPNMADNQWMRLVGLQEITGPSNPSTGVVLSCMFTAPPNVYLWVRSHSRPVVGTMSCYKQDSSTFHTIPTHNCSQIFSTTSNITTVSLKFTYVPPNRQQPLGDIHNNAQVHLNNCTESLTPDIVILKYFRVKSEVKDTMTLTPTANGNLYHHYTVPSDLIPVREAWKTGKVMCDSTGRDGPKTDTDIPLTCLR
ncbi:uncharacterized protein LOC110446052 [Mizuhopecten yessoensis]|uniref:uncharacterized protein LOC110446052 n=1 Tax=Mizuhopecten yessoensis TaxID=6573 RepID=UPI000B45B985|nr:uncharacterized protein LOC110446052 [Mizuhopecten yessoensis]XP_021346683.1 uncharacterized protein LOC110446052 [Mizuhopecten yessoensis]